MEETFDVDAEIEKINQAIEQIKATFAELQGRLKLLQAIKTGGYKIVREKDNEPGTE